MTYCIGVRLDEGLVFASDSRTHAGVDNFSRFCKMTVFERPGDRVIVLLSSGNLAGTQAVVSMLVFLILLLQFQLILFVLFVKDILKKLNLMFLIL